MWKDGDVVMYGQYGACKIVKRNVCPFGTPAQGSYFELHPLFADTILYVPMGQAEQVMRSLTERVKMEALLKELPMLLPLKIENEKQRREIYRKMWNAQSPLAWLRLLKTISTRRTEATNAHRRLSELDLQYEAMTKKCLYGEIAVLLQIPFDRVESYIKPSMEIGAQEAQGIF